MMFIKGFPIPPEEEKKIIHEIKDQRIQYIVMSNRAAFAVEPDVGILGKTHLVSLYRYITENFEPVEGFGRWESDGVWWYQSHAIKILKRKPS
jgi:hypothetical protein